MATDADGVNRPRFALQTLLKLAVRKSGVVPGVAPLFGDLCVALCAMPGRLEW